VPKRGRLQTQIAEVAVIADAPVPVQPCGGCRQKLREFSSDGVVVTMANLDGVAVTMTVSDLLPGAFTKDQLDI
jgi:cytidine deaminase